MARGARDVLAAARDAEVESERHSVRPSALAHAEHLEHWHIERQEEVERLLHDGRRRSVAHAALVQAHLLAQLAEHEQVGEFEHSGVAALPARAQVMHIVGACVELNRA